MFQFVLSLDDFIKILIALLVGGVIGLEREYRDKDAGFRTLIFICIGSTLFSILSIRIASLANVGDPGRIAAGIVSGVGFLGAGVILTEGAHIKGLTTAATIWLTAALGVGIGAGEYLLSLISAVTALVVLELFPWLEIGLGRIRDARSYELTCSLRFDKIAELERLIKSCGLRIKSFHRSKRDGMLYCTINTSGSPRQHDILIGRLFADPEVIHFHYS